MNSPRSYDAVPARRVAFLGLGVMGYPMAGHLARAGHQVCVYNRSLARAAAWVEEHAALAGRAAGTPAEAVQGAELVFACVGNDDDVRAVALGRPLPGGGRSDDGAFAAMATGAVWVDHTTASAQLARELHAAALARGLQCVDAPVSGGQAGAVHGRLTVMCGGDAAAFATAQPLLMHYARAATLLGAAGSGQLAKMVNQIAIAGLLQGLAEALAFGQRAGLDMPQVLQVIGQGAAQSWQMDHRGPTMLQDSFDFGFAVDWMRKDLGLVLDEARRNGAQLPVTALVDQFYAEVQALGGARWDSSSLMRRLRR